MCEKEAKLGWNMVEVRRKDVPDQKASIAVPLSFCAMIYISVNVMIAQAVRTRELTGRATERLVPSRATIKVITDNVTNATSSLGVTLKVSNGTPADWT